MFDAIKKYFKDNILRHNPVAQPALGIRRIRYKITHPCKLSVGVMRSIDLYVRDGKVSHKWLPFIKFYGYGSGNSTGYPLCNKDQKELKENIETQSVMLPEVRQIVTSTDRATLTFPAYNEPRWPGEMPRDPQAMRSPEIIDIPVHVMLISLTMGNSALEDPTFCVRDEFLEAASEAVAVAYDQLIPYGDGQGKLEGLWRRDKEWKEKDYQRAYSHERYPLDFATIIESAPTVDDYQKLFNAVPPKYRANSKWYMNSSTGLHLASIRNEKGDLVIDPNDASVAAVGVPDRYMGHEIVYNEYMDDIGKAGNVPVFFGDIKKAYAVARRDSVSLRRFNDSMYAELDQILLLGRARLGGQVINPDAYRVMRVKPAFENEVIITPEPIINVNVAEGVTREQVQEQMQKMSEAIIHAVSGAVDGDTPVAAKTEEKVEEVKDGNV